MDWEDIHFDNCPECSNTLQVLNDEESGFYYDGDPVRCVECDFMSGISVDESGLAWVQDS